MMLSFCSSHILTTQICAKLLLQPRLRDMDMNQHVNNVKYISWVLEVCAARSDSLNSQKQLPNNACCNSSLCNYMLSAQTILENSKSSETG